MGTEKSFLIHPGETIAEVLQDRHITQECLAAMAGATPDYVSAVIAGTEDISEDFATELENALGIPKSFWQNLQANYETELSKINNEREK